MGPAVPRVEQNRFGPDAHATDYPPVFVTGRAPESFDSALWRNDLYIVNQSHFPASLGPGLTALHLDGAGVFEGAFRSSPADLTGIELDRTALISRFGAKARGAMALYVADARDHELSRSSRSDERGHHLHVPQPDALRVLLKPSGPGQSAPRHGSHPDEERSFLRRAAGIRGRWIHRLELRGDRRGADAFLRPAQRPGNAVRPVPGARASLPARRRLPGAPLARRRGDRGERGAQRDRPGNTHVPPDGRRGQSPRRRRAPCGGRRRQVRLLLRGERRDPGAGRGSTYSRAHGVDDDETPRSQRRLFDPWRDVETTSDPRGERRYQVHRSHGRRASRTRHRAHGIQRGGDPFVLLRAGREAHARPVRCRYLPEGHLAAAPVGFGVRSRRASCTRPNPRLRGSGHRARPCQRYTDPDPSGTTCTSKLAIGTSPGTPRWSRAGTAPSSHRCTRRRWCGWRCRSL